MAALLGVQGVAFSLAQAQFRGNIGLANRLASYDGRIVGRLAAASAGPEATRDDRRRADELAQYALRRDATAIPAVSTLGINAQLRGDVTRARALFGYAQKLSRRDTFTQMWAIEDAVARGDVAGALTHYDIALRTAPRTSDLLFPVLLSASGDPAIRAALVRKLASKPRWSGDFVSFAARGSADPRATAVLFRDLARADVPVTPSQAAQLTDKLVTAGRPQEGWAFYAALRRDADPRRSRDPHFARTEGRSLFDWTPLGDSGIVTSIDNGVFVFSTPPGLGGPLLQQLQLLEPGNYQLTGRSTGLDPADPARPYWVLACADGRELGRVDLGASRRDGVFSGRYTVPVGCPVQTLTLVARPSDSIGGISGEVRLAQLGPVG